MDAESGDAPPSSRSGEVSIGLVRPHTREHAALLAAAERLAQAKYILRDASAADEVVLFGALTPERCLGFLQLKVQVIGRNEGRPALTDPSGSTLREGYVDAFGVLPPYRRQGLGRSLQEHAVGLCVERGCYQIRSRSPSSSRENYALKLSMGYAIQPSLENDSYFFIRTLPRRR